MSESRKVLSPPGAFAKPQPKAAAPVPPPPVAPAAPAACGDCRFWAGLTPDQQVLRGLEKRGPVGECREGPPAVRVGVGPILAYGLTDRDCPACGRGQLRK